MRFLYLFYPYNFIDEIQFFAWGNLQSSDKRETSPHATSNNLLEYLYTMLPQTTYLNTYVLNYSKQLFWIFIFHSISNSLLEFFRSHSLSNNLLEYLYFMRPQTTCLNTYVLNYSKQLFRIFIFHSSSNSLLEYLHLILFQTTCLNITISTFILYLSKTFPNNSIYDIIIFYIFIKHVQSNHWKNYIQ